MLQQPVQGAPVWVIGHGIGANGPQNRFGNFQGVRFAAIRQLGAFVRAWLMGMAEPVGAQAKEADDLTFDIGLDHIVTDIGVFAERLTVAFGGDAIFQELVHDAVAPHHTAAAVLEFQVRSSDSPTVVFPTHQVKGWHADVIEENRMLESRRRAPFPTRR